MKRSRVEESSSDDHTTKTPKLSTTNNVHESLALLKLPQLKEECKSRGLKVSGKKVELIQRILECDTQSVTNVTLKKDSSSSNLESLKVNDLKDRCRELGLKVSGTKKELIQRLENPDIAENKKKGADSDVPKSKKNVEDNDVQCLEYGTCRNHIDINHLPYKCNDCYLKNIDCVRTRHCDHCSKQLQCMQCKKTVCSTSGELICGTCFSWRCKSEECLAKFKRCAQCNVELCCYDKCTDCPKEGRKYYCVASCCDENLKTKDDSSYCIDHWGDKSSEEDF